MSRERPARRGKPIIGIVGGIGSGKSTVAGRLAELGCLVIDSDAHIRQAQTRPEVLATLRDWWGDGVIAPDGSLNRSAVAKIVFSSPREKARLESLLYPLIAVQREDMIRVGLQNPAVRAIILDSPLLLESNLDRQCDTILFIEASDEQRRRRVDQRSRWDADELSRRESCQAPLEEKRSRADYVIRNEGSIQELHESVRVMLERILAEYHA